MLFNSSQECILASLLCQSLLRPIRSLATNATHGPKPSQPQDPNPGHCDPLVRDLACESADLSLRRFSLADLWPVSGRSLADLWPISGRPLAFEATTRSLGRVDFDDAGDFHHLGVCGGSNAPIG